jgi:hypothetical protein
MNVLAQFRVRGLFYQVGFRLRSTGLLEVIRHTISTQFSSGYIATIQGALQTARTASELYPYSRIAARKPSRSG